MTTRNELYQIFKLDFSDEVLAQMYFRSMSDDELAEMFGLKVLRKGYFY